MGGAIRANPIRADRLSGASGGADGGSRPERVCFTKTGEDGDLRDDVDDENDQDLGF